MYNLTTLHDEVHVELVFIKKVTANVKVDRRGVYNLLHAVLHVSVLVYGDKLTSSISIVRMSFQ